MQTIFITGTDTECGKTYVTLKLLEFFKQKGKRVLAIKPVACGGILKNNIILNEDEELLKKAQNIDIDLSCYKYLMPVSPNIAAELENANISLDVIVKFCEKFSSLVDVLLVEGAGGLLVPLNHEQTWLDFIKKNDMQTILVIGMRLGCLNHGLLTEALLRQNKINTVGWIANCIDKNMLELSRNISTLQANLSIPFIGTVKYNGECAFNLK